MRENAELLRKDGVACWRVPGGMASPGEISNAVLNALGGPLGAARAGHSRGDAGADRQGALRGQSLVGKMGRAAAREAVRRGAEVMVVAANVGVKEPGVRWVDVEDYAGLEEATTRLATQRTCS